MTLSSEDTKLIMELAKPVIAPMVEIFLVPQLKKIKKWIKGGPFGGDISDDFWIDKFSTYLANTYCNSLYLTTLVFPNQQTKIKDLYIPLTISSSKDDKEFKINQLDLGLLEKYQKLIISDTAGMGKSTLLKWISISLFEQHKSIPVLVELRKIDNDNSIIKEILKQISPFDQSFDEEILYKFLKLGFFTVLFDGFDEIPFDLQAKVTTDMKTFINNTNANKFIITSRPDPTLTCFADFQSFSINPLKEQEAFALIKKLDGLSKVKYGNKLIQEIKEKNEQVKEFLINPFLVSLLFKAYTYNKDIPSKKVTFYEEVFGCLFKHHDLSKEGFKRPKRSRLDILDFEIILRHIGFATAKVGKVSYSKDELLGFIKDAKKFNDTAKFKEQSYLEDLSTTVPLFVKDGNEIKWAHKSLQDFFAAKFISNHLRKEDIIDKIYATRKFQYLNILDLIFELEPKIFRSIIIKSILEEYVRYHDNYRRPAFNISASALEERISATFGIRYSLVKGENEDDLEKIFDLFHSSLGKDNLTLSGAIGYHPNLFVFYEYSLVLQIIRLLGMRNEKLFLEKYDNKNYIEVLLTYPTNDLQKIDDNPSGLFNSQDYFVPISSFLFDCLKSPFKNIVYLLDYKKSKDMLKLIDQERLENESHDLLADL